MLNNNSNYPSLSDGFHTGSGSNWESGWTLGGGLEFALTDAWSARAEYMHYEFPEKTFTIDGAGDQASVSAKGDLVTIGVNYHFSRGAGYTYGGGLDVPLK